MPARRTPPGLKLLHPAEANAQRVAQAAKLRGNGLDWGEPPKLTAAALAYWVRLSQVFADDPVRFREAEQQAVALYCRWLAIADAALAELETTGSPAGPARTPTGRGCARRPSRWRGTPARRPGSGRGSWG